VPAAGTTGVLLARGSWFGGWSFYLKDGRQVAQGRIDRTILSSAGTNGESFDIGQDTGVPVTDDYAASGRYPGRISKVQVDLAPIDLKALQAAAAAAEASARRRSQ
jgi:arylsulfatase